MRYIAVLVKSVLFIGSERSPLVLFVELTQYSPRQTYKSGD